MPTPTDDKMSAGDEPGISARTTFPLEAAVVIDDVSWSPSAVHRALYECDSDLGEILVESVREVLAGESPASARELLRTLGVSALTLGDETASLYRDRVIDVAAGTEDGAATLIWMTRQLGTGHDYYGTSSPLDDLQHGDLPLLEAASRTPRACVKIDAEFREAPRAQREAVLSLLVDYAEAISVDIVTSGLTLRWLRREHADILPSSVTESVTPPQCSGSLGELVKAARESLDPDGRAVAMLRDIAAEPSEMLTYSALASMHAVSDSRPRQVAAELEELDLAERVKTRGRGAISLLAAGREFIDALDADIGIEGASPARVSQTPNSVSNGRENTRQQDVPPSPVDGDRPTRDRPARYPVRDLSWAEAATFANTAESGEIGLIDAPTANDWKNPNQPAMHYDERRDRLVVAAQAQNPMQYGVGLARALTDGKVFQEAITPSRLDENTGEGDLRALADGNLHVLRGCRELGYLKNEYDAEDYIARLQKEHEELLEATQRLAQEDYGDSDRNTLRGNILSKALGLAGTMAQICDLLGIDLVRGVWLPDQDNVQDVDALVRSWALHAAIDAHYGHYVAYRQLYEERREKRQSAGNPEIDQRDPVGVLTGSFAVVGDVGRVRDDDDGADVLLADLLKDALENPKEIHEDAPEISIHIPVKTGERRSQYAGITKEILDRKFLGTTREAVSMLQAFARSPAAAAEALAFGLSRETKPRDVELDEVRRALSTLEPAGLLEGMTPTVRDVVAVLLGADERLTQTELAERAGRSTQALRDNAEVLETLGLADRGPAGWRLLFPTADERGQGPVPWFLDDDDPRTVGEAQLHEVVQEIVDSCVDPSSDRWLDLQSLLWADPPDPWAVAEELGWLVAWMPVLAALTPGSELEDPDPTMVRMGARQRQTALAAYEA